jgi:hypothetical protein
MTTFSTNPLADINSRGRRMLKAQEDAAAHVWRLTDLIPQGFARFAAPDPQRALARAERREAARRAADSLLLR